MAKPILKSVVRLLGKSFCVFFPCWAQLPLGELQCMLLSAWLLQHSCEWASLRGHGQNATLASNNGTSPEALFSHTPITCSFHCLRQRRIRFAQVLPLPWQQYLTRPLRLRQSETSSPDFPVPKAARYSILAQQPLYSATSHRDAALMPKKFRLHGELIGSLLSSRSRKSAREAGLTDEEIQLHGRWNSDSYRLYIDTSTAHIFNASRRQR